MTTFQLFGVVLFCAALAFAYRTQLAALVKKLLGKAAVVVPPGDDEFHVDTSVALTIVPDIVAVTRLRDKLAAENCKEGVDACTQLLRVIVEHQTPAKGAV